MGNIITFMKNKYFDLFNYLKKNQNNNIIIKTSIYNNIINTCLDLNDINDIHLLNDFNNMNIHHLSILYDLIKKYNLNFYYDNEELNIQQNIYIFTILINILEYVKKLNNYQKTIFFFNYIHVDDNNININIENLCKHIISDIPNRFSIEIYQFSIVLYNILKDKFNDNSSKIKLLDFFYVNRQINFDVVIDNLIINLYNIIFYNYLIIYFTNYYKNVNLDYITAQKNVFQLECCKILYINNIKCNLCNNNSYFNYKSDELPKFCIIHKNNDMVFKNLNIINDNEFIINIPFIQKKIHYNKTYYSEFGYLL
jgi:hypothetical protein